MAQRLCRLWRSQVTSRVVLISCGQSMTRVIALRHGCSAPSLDSMCTVQQ